MMKIRLFLVLLLTGSAAFAAKPPAAPAQPAFGATVEVNVVNVEVYASAKDGSRVTDLRKDDFTVLEDGKPVEITNFQAVLGSGASPAVATAGGELKEGLAPAAPEEGWNLIVYFDNLSLRPGSRDRALRQLRTFFQQLAPGDRVMLVTYDQGLHVRVPFTSDLAALDQALDEIGKLSARGIEGDRDRRQAFNMILTTQEESLNSPEPLPCPQRIADPAHTYASLRRNEVRRSLSALTLLVNSLSGVPGRKSVLHVSDGLPLTPGEEVFQFLVEICGGSGTSGLGENPTQEAMGPTGVDANGNDRPPKPGASRDVNPYQVFDARAIGPQAYQAASQGPLDAQSYSLAKDFQTLAAHANAQRVTLYTLQASGLAGPDIADAGSGPAERLFMFPSIGTAARMNQRDSLQLLADETGGRSILDANNFLPDLTRMREDTERFYSLGFTPPHNGDGREHKIEVRVKRPGLRLRYRQSYRDKPLLEKVVDRTFAALLYGVEDNPLDVRVELGEQTADPSGVWTVPVKLRIPLFKLAILNHEDVGLFEGNLKLFVATHTPDGGSSPLRQVAVPIRIPRKQVLNAMGQYYLYTLSLQLKPGAQQVAVAVRDEIGATTSYLSRSLEVGDKVTPASR
jgi:VWFA-related protein